MKKWVRSSSALRVFERMRWVAVVGVLSVLFSGCSFLFSHRGREYTDDSGAVPRTTFTCPGNVPPVLDSIWGTLNMIGAIRAVAADPNDWDRQDHTASRKATIAVGVGWVALSVASAAYGVHQTSACKEDLRRSMEIQESGVRSSSRTRRGYVPPPSRPVKSTYEAPPAPSEDE